MWNKFLFDLGLVVEDEPFKKLINQGMIQGVSCKIRLVNDTAIYPDNQVNIFIIQADLPFNFSSELSPYWDIINSEEKVINNISYYSIPKGKYLNGQFKSLVFQGVNFETEIDRLNASILNEVVLSLDKILQIILIEKKQNIEFNKKIEDLEAEIIEIKNKAQEDLSKGIFTFINSQENLSGIVLLLENLCDMMGHPFQVLNIKPHIKNIQGIIEYKSNESFYTNRDFILANKEVEKMSKSKYNVVNPDDIINEYGADTLRMYEMFLGPLEQSKPWNTNGISGVHNFLRRYWRLIHTDAGFNLSEEPATKDELKALHKTIKKVQDDIERFSFNTAVSSFMICVNELSDLKCNKRAIIEPLTALLSPFAPHICEEVWSKLGHVESVITAAFPQYNAEYTVDDAFAYPIQFNGKMKFNVEVPLNISKEEIEKLVLADEKVQKQLAGAAPKKVIVVPGKIVNIVA